jgi:hypothetical protein
LMEKISYGDLDERIRNIVNVEMSFVKNWKLNYVSYKILN